MTLAADIHRCCAVALGVALCLESGVARAECTKDTDCKGSRICEAGQCVASTEPVETPTTRVPEPADEPPRRRHDFSAGGTHRRSTGLMVTGIILTAAGGVAGVTALSFSLGASSCNDSVQVSSSGYSTYSDTTCDTFRTITLVGAVAFVALVGVGIPMIAIGAKRVPNEQATRPMVLAPWAAANAGGLSLSGNF